MKDLFENILKVLPQPFVVALLFTTAAYFIIYYHYGYSTHHEAFRNVTFRNFAAIAFFIAILVMINGSRTDVHRDKAKPLLIFPLIAGDADGNLGAAFKTSLEASLDKVMNRSKSILHMDSFIEDEASAAKNLSHFNASAVIYAPRISHIGDKAALCFHLLTSREGTLPRFAPVTLDDAAGDIQTITYNICGQIVDDAKAAIENPLVAKIVELEERLDSLSIAVNYSGITPVQPTKVEYKNKYALIIGLNTIATWPDFRLASAERDAKEISQLLSNNFGFKTTLLLGELCTLETIESSLVALSQKMHEKDLFVFYFSGNAIITKGEGRDIKKASLVTYDFDPDKTNMTGRRLVEILSKLPPQHSIVLVDACHAAIGLDQLSNQERASIIPKGKTIQILTSSGTEQTSYEGIDGGFFSQGLRLALKANLKDTKALSVDQIATQIQEYVEEKKYPQTTIFLKLGTDSSTILLSNR